MMARARYIMVGGFLGAGKTTAMLRLGEHLSAQGVRVGLVTNDQSSGLADTALLSASGFPVEEITGGCFCCRFNSLTDAAERLTARVTPDVFLAEPVGSCTDLKATVSYPLRRLYGDNFSVAPFSVLLDPARALRVLGLEEGRRFSDKVLYVYGKQLDEADVLVINKIDTADPARLAVLRTALRARCPRAVLFEASAKTGTGLEAWFAHILASDDESRANLDIDYDEYADGEALLGWLNCTARLSGRTFDGNEWVARLAETVQRQLRQRDIEIAHLKMTLTPEQDRDLCVVNAVSTEAPPVIPFRLQDVIDAGELIINLRAEGDPEILRREAVSALMAEAASAGLAVIVDHIEHFRPGRPVPTHRVVMAGGQ
jgi:G3E family GTPase